jgi:hypothetical protein
MDLPTRTPESRSRQTLGHKIPTRITIVFAMIIMVISSPIVIFENPIPVVAATPLPLSTDPTSMITTPSTINQDGGDFTTQAELAGVTSRQTNNIVNTKAYYDIVFRTATTGAIKKVDVTFPFGTDISTARLLEREGLGPGTISVTGQTFTYTVNSAVSIPANTPIRLQLTKIVNPASVDNSYVVTVTTRNAANAIIDGPTQSTTYPIKQIENGDIANNAITTTKIAPGNVNTGDIATGAVTTPKIADGAVTTPKIADKSITGNKIADSTSTNPSQTFMRNVGVRDTPNGNAVGWNPNGVTTTFTILDPGIGNFFASYVSATVEFSGNVVCIVSSHGAGKFDLACITPPLEGAELRYIITYLPSHIIQ